MSTLYVMQASELKKLEDHGEKLRDVNTVRFLEKQFSVRYTSVDVIKLLKIF
jgi:hypothetical protein